MRPAEYLPHVSAQIFKIWDLDSLNKYNNKNGGCNHSQVTAWLSYLQNWAQLWTKSAILFAGFDLLWRRNDGFIVLNR